MERFEDMSIEDLEVELQDLRHREDNNPDQGCCSNCHNDNDFYIKVDLETEWSIDSKGEVIELRDEIDEPYSEPMSYWYCAQCEEDAVVQVGDAADYVEDKLEKLKQEEEDRKEAEEEERREKEERYKEELKRQEQEEIEKEKEHQLNQMINNILVAMMPQIREQILDALKVSVMQEEK